MSIEIINRIEDYNEQEYNQKANFVIIDVVRFSTTTIFLLKNGVNRIKPFKNIQTAIKYKEKSPENVILLGEKNGQRIQEFDYGNSPTIPEKNDLKNKTIGIRTTNGTRAVKKINPKNNIYIGSTVNAKYIAEHLKTNKYPNYLLAVGRKGKPSKEDIIGAKLMKKHYKNKKISKKTINELKNQIKQTESAKKLKEINKTTDLKKIQKFNSINIIPKIKNGTIKNIK